MSRSVRMLSVQHRSVYALADGEGLKAGVLGRESTCLWRLEAKEGAGMVVHEEL